MLRIFGRRSSFNVQKVMWLVDELDITQPERPNVEAATLAFAPAPPTAGA